MIKVLLFLIIISFINASIIYTPSGYYNLKNFSNTQKISHDFYYPDICNGTIPNIDGIKENTYLVPGLFPNIPASNANLMITKDTKFKYLHEQEYDNLFNILCIEGSLEIESGSRLLKISAIVILPGGSLIMNDVPIEYKSLDPQSSKVDPFSFFPGLLSLGGTLTMKGGYRSFYNAKRIDENSLSISDLSQINPNFKTAQIYSETFTNGQTCNFQININTITLQSCLPIPSNDKSISVYFWSPSGPLFSPFMRSDSITGASIYITGDTNVHIENYSFSNLGKTNNKPYNDTQLIFSSNDPNIVTDIIVGTNQRYRNSIYIEFSNRSTIIGCLLEENKESKSPLLIQQTKVNINSNIFSSKSGSSIISLYNSEIQSSNNAYYLIKPSSTATSADQMDYGFEGNGIYSHSPYVTSTSDIFIGHSNAFKFNFANNNDTTNSFNIINSRFSQQNSNSTNTSNNYLVSIVSNKQQPNNYFIFNNLTATEPINIKTTTKSALIFKQLVASNKFSVNDEITRLDIINSNINSVLDSNFLKSPPSTSIINSYVYGKEGSIEATSNQTYGSIITPYYYNDTSVLNQIKISSVTPNEPYQIAVNNTLNVFVKLESKTSSPITQLSCILSGSNINQIKETADQTKIGCNVPIYMDKEGQFNLRVSILNNTSNRYLYSIDLPTIIIYNKNSFYYGLRMVDPSKPSSLKSSSATVEAATAATQTIVEGNSYLDGCQQQTNCSLSSNSNNIKYQSNLPALTNSNELNVLYSSGVTTTIPNQAININLVIDSNIQVYQFQLHFTYIPSSQQISPLSVFIQDKAVYLLEPISGSTASLKNIKFIYENSNSLNNIKISVISNGDIYLTSLSTNSIIIPPIIIPPTLPPITPTVSPISNTPALTVGLSVGMCSLGVISVVALTLFIRHRKLNQVKSSIKMKDIENIGTNKEKTTTSTTTSIIVSQTDENNTTTLQLTELTQQPQLSPISLVVTPTSITEPTEEPSQASVTSSLSSSKQSTHQVFTPLAIIHKPEQPSLVDFNKPYKTEMGKMRRTIQKPTVTYSSFPTIETNSSKTKITYIPLSILLLKKPTEKYVTHPNIIKALDSLKCYSPSDPLFPLKFNTTVMDFAKGIKCKVGETYIDTLQITNTSNRNQSGYLIFPVDNHTGICSTLSECFNIRPFETEPIGIALTLTCTTNYFQNFAIVVEGVGYTLITIHMESELSVKLDFGELGFDEFLGEGTFGIVFKGTWRSQVVAIKFLKVKNRIKNVDELYHEMDILSKLRSKYIVSFIGGIVSVENVCIVTEYIPDGNLGNLIHVKKYELSIKQKIRFAIDICRGMEFIHQCGILHRDLKPDNILVVDFDPTGPVCVKISDFGTSKEASERNRNFTQAIGTPIYMSSEILENKPYNKSTDIHSFAITLYEIMTGVVPYSEIQNEFEIATKIMEGYRPSLRFDTIDPKIQDIIVKCWGPPEDRPTFGKILQQLEDIFESYSYSN